MSSKFCSYCNVEHALTQEYWYSLHLVTPQCKRYSKEWRRANADRRREANREQTNNWRKQNPERWKELQKSHYEKHKSKIVKRNHEYAAKRKKVDVNYKLTCLLRGRITKALTAGWKSGSAVRDLGCSIPELRTHLESKFTGGMSWENYGRSGWHIDHIRPLSSFNLNVPEEFQAAVHYTNLQPLWASENCSKSNKWSAEITA